MILAKSREKGMSIRFFHMLHFVLPCLVMSNICYMHTLDKVSTSSNFPLFCRAMTEHAMWFPEAGWMYHGHTTVLLKVIASIQRCSTCRGPLWYVLYSCYPMLYFFGFAACLRDIARIACWIRQYFWLLLWGYDHAHTFFSRMIIDIS